MEYLTRDCHVIIEPGDVTTPFLFFELSQPGFTGARPIAFQGPADTWATDGAQTVLLPGTVRVDALLRNEIATFTSSKTTLRLTRVAHPHVQARHTILHEWDEDGDFVGLWIPGDRYYYVLEVYREDPSLRGRRGTPPSN
ncbi:MAG TPA: hypothetical protein VKE69_04270 [Planctomycetota bacterium]|nr:hypothetical protein [Planctomycetota bacterium]